jgi:hypothetical protein
MSGFMIVPASNRRDALERGLPSTDKEAAMVVYVRYRVPVEVAEWPGWTLCPDPRAGSPDRLGPGLVILRCFLQTNRSKLNAHRRTQKTSSEALRPKSRWSRNTCYTLKRNSITSPSSGW